MSGALVPVGPAPAALPVPYSDAASDRPQQSEQRHGIRVHPDAVRALVDRLKAAYTALPAAERQAKRVQFERELAQAYDGTHKHSAGTAVAVAPGAAMTLDEARAIVAAAEPVALQPGYFMASAFKAEHLSGYNLDKWQHCDFSGTEFPKALAQCRAGNLSQQTVDRMIESERAK